MIVDFADDKEPGVVAASAALRLDPGNIDYLYTLVHAQLAVNNVSGAAAAMRRIRRIAPSSYLGAVAEAYIELHLAPEMKESPTAEWLCFLTCGIALIGVIPYFVVRWVRFRRHVRRADECGHEALSREPDLAFVQNIVAKTAELQGRHLISLRFHMSAARSDVRFANSNAVVSGIVGRTSGLYFAAGMTWALAIHGIDAVFENRGTVAFVSLVLAVLSIGIVHWFEYRQVRIISPRLRDRVYCDWLPIWLACCGVFMWPLYAYAFLVSPPGEYAGTSLAGIVCAPIGVLWIVALVARQQRAKSRSF